MSNVTGISRPWSLLAAVLVVASATSARAEKLLRWKFTPGETLRHVTEQKMVTTMDMGTPVTMTMTQMFEVSWKVNSVDAEGVASVTQTVDRARVKMESPQGIMIDYDSASGEEPEGIAKMLVSVIEAMLNRPVSMKVSAWGKTSDMQVPQAMIDAMNKLPMMEKGGGVFTEDTFRQMGGSGDLPEEAVSPGDTWTEERAIELPMVGKHKLGATYEYAGTETRNDRELEKILTTLRMELLGSEDQPLKFTSQDSELKGTIYFDNQAGRLVETDMSGKIKLEVTLGDMSFKMDIDMDIQMKTDAAGTSQQPAPKE